MKSILLPILFLMLAHGLQAQSTGCTGNAEEGQKVLLPGEKERIVTYYIRHDFTLETDSIFSPYIYSVSFNHAYVEEPFVPCQDFKVNPEIQPPGFEPFAPDTIINDQPYNNLVIPVDSLVTELSILGDEAVDSAFAENCNSKAKASTCIHVDPLQNDELTGTIQSYGFSQAIEPATNNDVYAFSWSGVTIEDGQPIKQGSVTWEPQLKSKARGKSRSIRQKAGTNDPVMFYAKNLITGHDTSATLLSIVMRFQTEDDTLEVENYWANDTVHIESDSLLFKIQYSSVFTVQQGFIYLLVKNGQVFQSLKSGIFMTTPLPPPGTQVPFNFPLYNQIQFDYNMDATNLFGNDSMVGQLFMYGNPENNFVRTYDSTKLIPHYRKPSCPGMNDGRIELVVNYGTPPYNYFWSNGNPNQNLNGVTAGTYTVMVMDAFGTPAQATFVLNDPLPVFPNATVFNVTCKGAHDGIIVLNPSGGTSPYTYLWNNGNTQAFRNGLYPKTHTVTVTDSKGCSVVSTYNITQPTVPLTLSVSKKNLKCGNKCNGYITISPSGGVPPFAYNWNTGHSTSTISNLCAGTYTCTVTDANGCVKTKTVTLTQNPPLSVTAIIVGTTAVALETGGVPPYMYFWNSSPPQFTSTATGLIPGTTYKVKVTDFKGCTATHVFTLLAKIAETVHKLFPNPTHDIITLAQTGSNEDVEKIIIRDQTGKAMLTYNFNSISNKLHPIQIDLSSLAASIYYAEIYTKKTVFTEKVIKLNKP